jgi:hypothetical protein
MIILRNYAAPAASPVTPSLSISLPMMPAWCTWHRTVSHHQRLDKTRRAIGRSQSKRGRTKPETPFQIAETLRKPETRNRKPETGNRKGKPREEKASPPPRVPARSATPQPPRAHRLGEADGAVRPAATPPSRPAANPRSSIQGPVHPPPPKRKKRITITAMITTSLAGPRQPLSADAPAAVVPAVARGVVTRGVAPRTPLNRERRGCLARLLVAAVVQRPRSLAAAVASQYFLTRTDVP